MFSWVIFLEHPFASIPSRYSITPYNAHEMGKQLNTPSTLQTRRPSHIYPQTYTHFFWIECFRYESSSRFFSPHFAQLHEGMVFSLTSLNI